MGKRYGWIDNLNDEEVKKRMLAIDERVILWFQAFIQGYCNALIYKTPESKEEAEEFRTQAWNHMQLIFLSDKFQSLTPIEQMMAVGLQNGILVSDKPYKSTPQVNIGPYRVDFLVVKNKRKLIVECDGHDWHEKTKEQAARDKKRDRYFVKNGYRVIRFTGSEIWNKPHEVLKEVLQIV